MRFQRKSTLGLSLLGMSCTVLHDLAEVFLLERLIDLNDLAYVFGRWGRGACWAFASKTAAIATSGQGFKTQFSRFIARAKARCSASRVQQLVLDSPILRS